MVHIIYSLYIHDQSSSKWMHPDGLLGALTLESCQSLYDLWYKIWKKMLISKLLFNATLYVAEAQAMHIAVSLQ